MTSSTKRILWLVVLIVVIVIISIVSNKTPSQETGPIKIGFVGPLTGDTSSLGVPSKTATSIAVDEINAAGGINGRPLQLIAEDGQCNTKAGANAGNKLVNVDKVTAIIGGLCSSETSAFVGQAMQNKTIVVSYCSSAPNLSSSGNYFFRTYPSDAYQGKFAAEYAYTTLGARKVAVAYHISDWGTGIKDVFEKRFKELGGAIVAEEGVAQEVRDYRTQLGKIKAANPDYIYAPLYSEGGIVFINQLNQLGIKTKVLGGDAWSDLKFQKEVSGKADILFAQTNSSISADLTQKIEAKLGVGQSPSICAPQAYDAVKVLAQALTVAGTDPEALQKEVRKTNYDGVSGKIGFDQNGDVTTVGYIIKRIQNGTAVEVK